MRYMKWLLLAIPIMLLFATTPVYAGDGMDVEVNISGGSDVEVNTGDNSNVDVNTGANNNVYINGQDINEPTVIKKTIERTSYNRYYSERLSKLEYWQREMSPTFSLFGDGLAKLIAEFEEGKLTQEELDGKLTELELMMTDAIARIEEDVEADRVSNQIMAESLQFRLSYLEWQVAENSRITIWWIIGLIAGIAVLGGLLWYRTRY